MKNLFNSAAFVVAFLLVIGTTSFEIAGQNTDQKPKLSAESQRSRDYALGMLDEMRDALKEHYYDQKFGGMDLKARIETAKARVKTLEYNWQMYRVLAQVLMELD